MKAREKPSAWASASGRLMMARTPNTWPANPETARTKINTGRSVFNIENPVRSIRGNNTERITQLRMKTI